jgi:hypothetical protein
MPTTILNLSDLDNLISDFEHQFGVSSLDMLKEQAVRRTIPEDVLLRWETYVFQRVNLRKVSEDLHREYLLKLHRESVVKAPTPSDQVELAA